MQVRELAVGDAAEYSALRLRMLREYSEAFTSSFEEDSVKPLVWAQHRFAPSKDAPHGFVLRAFTDDGVLIGSVGLAVEARTKQRHKGFALRDVRCARADVLVASDALCCTPVSIARGHSRSGTDQPHRHDYERAGATLL